ncbi:MAG: NUDIX hydrolase [Chloroflexota bacterium]|nr:NUDIX hydrolase [Chloroflexota bacterium]
MLTPAIESQIADLATRYGPPQRVTAVLDGWQFSPLTLEDRYGEVCMVVRRLNGKLITAKKTFYPAGAFRLLTGGIDHGELIAAALLREVAEETGLAVVVRRFLAVIEYQPGTRQGDEETRRPQIEQSAQSPSRLVAPSPMPSFATFAFLLDEIGGTLQSHDPSERIEAFRELAVSDLPTLAETLEQVPDTHDQEIDGSWRDWGRFRAVPHRVIYAALTSDG